MSRDWKVGAAVLGRGVEVDFKDLVIRNRSCRRFHESYPIAPDTLYDIADHGRYTASGFNKQPLKFILSCDPVWNQGIFTTLTWGGSVKDWPQPEPGERPSAYIVILTDTGIRDNADIDVGVAAQTLLLAAVSKGLGGCMMRAIDRRALQQALSIPEHLVISMVVAIGKPAEKTSVEDAAPGSSLAFYRTADLGTVVPKRTLNELVYRMYASDPLAPGS